MRLLQFNDSDNLRFSEELTDKIPAYGILSHKWGADEEEITYDDILNGSGKSKAGYSKVHSCGQQVRKNGLQYFWADTCCIDKRSSSELGEAVNSMYNWYQSSQCCYVYLGDVGEDDGLNSFRASVWFTRGWTLQELLAPSKCLFFDRDWHLLGDRISLAQEIAEVTGVDVEALKTGDLRRYSIAQKMSWAANRHTKRTEDRAYSLMGLFEVNMPLVYGEGRKAFLRLQEEIIKDTDDHSIFAWHVDAARFSGLMAPTPASFAGCEHTIQWRSGRGSQPFSMTNRGLSIRLQITPWSADTYLAYLECSAAKDVGSSSRYVRVGIFLRRLTEDDQYARICVGEDDLYLDETNSCNDEDRPSLQRQVFIRKHIGSEEETHCSVNRAYGWEVPYAWLPPTAEVLVTHRLLDEHVAILPPGGWGQTMAINVSAELKGLRHIILGFDFEFNPVCLLVDAFFSRSGFGSKANDHLDWSTNFPDDFDWYKVEEGTAVYRRKDHNGVWALKGDRIQGLDVTLSKSPSHNGTRLILKRNEKNFPFAWTVFIGDSDGPFRQNVHKDFEKSWGDRRNFQASFGLKVTDKEDLEYGGQSSMPCTTHSALSEDSIGGWRHDDRNCPRPYGAR